MEEFKNLVTLYKHVYSLYDEHNLSGEMLIGNAYERGKVVIKFDGRPVPGYSEPQLPFLGPQYKTEVYGDSFEEVIKTVRGLMIDALQNYINSGEA